MWEGTIVGMNSIQGICRSFEGEKRWEERIGMEHIRGVSVAYCMDGNGAIRCGSKAILRGWRHRYDYKHTANITQSRHSTAGHHHAHDLIDRILYRLW